MQNFVTMPLTMITPGMKLAQMVVDENGRVLLERGTLLTHTLLQYMNDWGITAVAVFTGEVVPEPLNKPELFPKNDVPDEFATQYKKIANEIYQVFDKVRLSNERVVPELSQLAHGPVHDMIHAVGVINHIQFGQEYSDYLIHHSINVAVIAGLLGKWLNLAPWTIENLILAGLLHDIGKCQIPLEILNKPGKLTAQEMTVMQQHTYLGYQILKQEKSLPPEVLYGVLEHHERMDGSGYPLKVTGDSIHLFGRILAIADIYDAMTSDRVYQERVSPFTVVETLVNDMFDKLDVKICTAFLNNVQNCFLGNVVELSDGRKAEVIYLNQFMAARPVVRTENDEFIDLERNKELSIVKLVNT